MVRQTAELKFICIDHNRNNYPINLMCAALKVSCSGYHHWRSRPESAGSKENRRLANLIEKVHLGSRKTYGSPRIHAILTGKGESCSRGRVERIMRKNNLKAKTKRKFRITTDSKHKLPIVENILDRNFSVGIKQNALAGDITYLWTDEGWLYLAVVMQLSTRKILGWSMSETMDRSLVINALKMAARRSKIKNNALFHSDRGSQYASADHRAVLDF
ncbi:MAG: IS3 family transposase, partial [Oligoflexales bacterium]|nr:IS3 family transposase [Oligoflexales bacterium]